MYTVPVDIILESRTREKKTLTEDPFAEMTDYLKHQTASTKQPHTLEKLGINTNLLNVVSVARLATSSSTIQDVKYCLNRKFPLPINMVVMSHFVKAWSIGDDGNALCHFQSLSESRGETLGEIRAMSYNSLEEVDTHSPTFLKLFKADELMDFGDLRIIREAACPMLHLIFIVTNMRYKFQQELLLALNRLMIFLKCNEFGKSNPKSKLQNRLCLFYTFREIEQLRQEITFFRTRASDSLIVNLCRKIPNLEPSSYISKIHAQR